MREMKYGLLCEDDAHREFLRMALSFLAADSTNFEEVKTHIQAKNKREVDRNFAKACSVAFVTYNVDVFFVVRDVDSVNDVNFSVLYTMFHGGLTEPHRHRSVIVLPVQCIEHWLWYLKHYNENPTMMKNIPLETRTRNDAKKEVYGHIKTSIAKQKPIIQELMRTADLKKLSHHSASFRKFHGDFMAVLQSLLPA